MGCIYSDREGICTLWDEECKGRNYENDEMGWSVDDDGTCAVEDDPDPTMNCSSFESNDPNWEPDES